MTTASQSMAYPDAPSDRLSELSIRALAALIHADIRPDWDSAGIVAALRSVRGTTTADKLAVAYIRGAADRSNRTPAFIRYANNRAHRDDQPCTDHPRAPRRPGGECSACFVDRLAEVN